MEGRLPTWTGAGTSRQESGESFTQPRIYILQGALDPPNECAPRRRRSTLRASARRQRKREEKCRSGEGEEEGPV